MTNKLAERIGAVVKDVGALAVDARNTQQNYDYISADKILAVVGAAMAKHGLAVVPSITSQRFTRNDYAKPNGQQGTLWLAEADMAMIITDIDGNAQEALWAGAGVDYASPDKALYKAITSGHKYFLMKLFTVGVGNEDGEYQESAPPAAQPAAANGTGKTVSAAQIQAINAVGSKVYGSKDWPAARERMKEYYGVKSTKDLTMAQASAAIDHLQAKVPQEAE